MEKKSKSPVYYCKWCDEVLKGDHQFCSASCKSIWEKTRRTPTEKLIAEHQDLVNALRERKVNIHHTCKMNYQNNKDMIKEHPDHMCASNKILAHIYAHIYNKNHEKALKMFAKLKTCYQDHLDACLFDGRPCGLDIEDPENTTLSELTGEEAIRVQAIISKLTLQSIELMIQGTFH